jgi:hypothetical protein
MSTLSGFIPFGSVYPTLPVLALFTFVCKPLDKCSAKPKLPPHAFFAIFSSEV